MRIEELKRIAEENDYILTRPFKDFRLTKIVNVNYININYINISSECENKIWVSITTWCDDKDFNMIKAAVKFAKTPIEEREEEKKFYLKHRWIKGCVIMYLYRNELNGHCYLGEKNVDPTDKKGLPLKKLKKSKKNMILT